MLFSFYRTNFLNQEKRVFKIVSGMSFVIGRDFIAPLFNDIEKGESLHWLN